MTYRKKLIEVALPLEEINAACIYEKGNPFIKGHPRNLHQWWARRPLAACRAVLWSSLVDDPSEYMPDEESANRERDRLFAILEDLVKWENINNEIVLDAAKLEIARSVARDLGCDVPVGKQAVNDFLATKAPHVLDPFAGGGSIPLEAQRLGLRAYASDLNPVAVLINKALIEIPPKFAGIPPVHPPEPGQRQDSLLKKEWKGTQGLAEDVRYYGKWMRDEAEKRIGDNYPSVKITQENIREDIKKLGIGLGDELKVITWLWARTVKCPNPACGAEMPLVASYTLSAKKGKNVYISPSVEGKKVFFKVISSKQKDIPPKVGRGAQFRCLACGQIASEKNIRTEIINKRVGTQLMAIVAESLKGRVYLSPDGYQEEKAKNIIPKWVPDEKMNQETPNLVSGRGYGIEKWHELFTSRQLSSLSTLVDLLVNVREKIKFDASNQEFEDPDDYAKSVVIYLAFAIDKLADYLNAFCTWNPGNENVGHLFSKQAIPMVWDFCEANPLEGGLSFDSIADGISKVFEKVMPNCQGKSEQVDAMKLELDFNPIICTDPPYYSNISYADLADFFYVWLRRSLMQIYPQYFPTILTPKKEELVATPDRFNGSKTKAYDFFEKGLFNAFTKFSTYSANDFPIAIFYAFKQTEEEALAFSNLDSSTISTGWETMLQGLLTNNYTITGTWPIRTERSARSVGMSTNALASSIVLVCRPRSKDAGSITRREFLSELKRELPKSLRQLQQGNIAPVDLAQAAIGPGMAIFSRYKTVLEATGDPMPVRAALSLINQSLDEYLAEQEGEYDGDTRWALAWFEQYGHEQGPYGVAETLSKAKNTSVEGLSHAGFLEARGGKVRLLKRDELDQEWDPTKDKRLTAWEATQYLIRTLDKEGEKGAGALLGKLGSFGETARDLAYRLYTICERKGWAQEALAYNMLVVAWPRIKEQSGKGPRQESLL